MTNYQVGQKLEINVVGLRKNSIGSDYIAINDGEFEYRIFNVLKCQLSGELPNKLYVIVKSIDAFNKVKMVQDTQRVLAEHYETDKMYRFDITDVKEDRNKKKYYVIEDDFAEQWFYIVGDQTHQVGDEITLICKGLGKSGWLDYSEYTSQPIEEILPVTLPIHTTPLSTNTFVKYGPESQEVEYKTSIVYSAKNSEIDVASQTTLIVEELAALMNTKGGHLIIGVKDENGSYEITGINEDYLHLNEDETDNFTYSATSDGFKQKILSKLNFLCPLLAGSLVQFEFKSKGNRDFCVINVEKSTRPIWVKGEKDLFIRQDGRMKRIFGEALTEHIFKMMKPSVEFAAGGANALANLDEEALTKIIKQVINSQKPEIQLPPAPKREIDFWVVWDTEGVWRRQRDKAENCFMQVPCYKNMSKPILVFCYASGRVSAMEWAKIRSKVNLKEPQKNIWYQLEKPTHIFLAEVNDLLMIRSFDHNGLEYVKLHALTDFNAVAKGGAQGSPILPDNTVIKDMAVIDATYLHAINGLICSKADRSKVTGTPINTAAPELAKQIAYIEKLLV